MSRIGIIGSGPTAIYTLHALLGSAVPLDVTVYEKTGSAGTGMPYRQETNHEALLANIASIELPPLQVTLVDWLQSLSKTGLAGLGLEPEDVTERAFFPRVTLGTYFRDQFFQLVERAHLLGHKISVMTRHQVDDVHVVEDGVRITGVGNDLPFVSYFDYVVVATGHTVGDVPAEADAGYLDSPYPTTRLQNLTPGRIGILGTSLSGIDATISIAMDQGEFDDSGEAVSFRCGPGSEALRITMMSRNGLLPEADFFCPIPYQPLEIFTETALDGAIEEGSLGLLERAMSLFTAQLTLSDPDWSRSVGLARLDADSFPETYFAPRVRSDAFSWARSNLAEVLANHASRHTVGWRYAILRMHEIMEAAVTHFDDGDRSRFDRGMKRMFIDNYAAIPPESVQRLLALNEAGILTVERLGKDYEVLAARGSRAVETAEGRHEFDIVINATGEGAAKSGDVPFAGLREQLGAAVALQRPAAGGLAQVPGEGPAVDAIYMASLPYLMTDRPFIQGLVSSHELGSEIAADIIRKISSQKHGIASIEDLLVSAAEARPASRHAMAAGVLHS
jgi:uncharacterized NAD(P)/FAD-binding protein YdhS